LSDHDLLILITILTIINTILLALRYR